MTSTHPSPAGRWRILGGVLLVVVLCLPPLLAGLREADTTFHMEVITILSSQETWVRTHDGEKGAWLIPSWNGRPRIEKPPLTIWCNMLAWSGLDPATAPADTLVWRARLVAIGLLLASLLVLHAVGRALWGESVGLLGAVATGTIFLFLRQGRMASYDAYLVALGTLAVAAGLWAMKREGHAVPGRRAWTGWVLSGLLLGAAVMAKGPLAYLFVLGPLALAVATGRGRRIANSLGLVLSALVSSAVAAPWFIYVNTHLPAVAETLVYEYRAVQADQQPPWYYVQLILWVFPWSLWLVGGLGHPFREKTQDLRRELWPAWWWFVWIVLVMSIPIQKHQRYIVPVLPAAGLVIAQYVLAYPRRAPQARLALVHGILLGWASLALGLFLVFQEVLLAKGLLKRIEFPGIAPAAALALTAVLLVVAWLVVRAHVRGRALAAGLLTACWMSVLATTAFTSYVRSDHGRYRDRADAERVAAAVQGRPVYYLLPEGMKHYTQEPDQKFLLYARRVIPDLKPADLPRAAKADGPVFVICGAELGLDEQLESQGFEPVLEFRDNGRERVLYGKL